MISIRVVGMYHISMNNISVYVMICVEIIYLQVVGIYVKQAWYICLRAT